MSDEESQFEQLSAYLDGEMEPDEARRLKRRLKDDRELAAELERLRAVRGLVHDLPHRRAPSDFAQRVLAEAERSCLMENAHAQTPATPLRWVRYLASAAVLLVAASVGIIVFTTLQQAQKYGKAPMRDRDERDPIVMAKDKAGTDELDTMGKVADRLDGDVLARGGEGFEAGRSARTKATAVAGLSPRTAGKAYAFEDLPHATNEIINTDNLGHTQQEVEEVLAANAVFPLETNRQVQAGQKAMQARQANYARAQSGRQVQYVLFVTPELKLRVQAELQNIRGRQNVAQARTDYDIPSRDESGGKDDGVKPHVADKKLATANGPAPSSALPPPRPERLRSPPSAKTAAPPGKDETERAPGEPQDAAPHEKGKRADSRGVRAAGRGARQRETVTQPATSQAARMASELITEQALARVQPLVITLNYLAPDQLDVTLERARSSRRQPTTGATQTQTGPAH